MKAYLTVGEMGRMFGLNVQTLHYYDKIGLFRPAYVDPNNGYRYYSTNQIDYLDTILVMKKMGFSLQEIKEHMQRIRREAAKTEQKPQDGEEQ